MKVVAHPGAKGRGLRPDLPLWHVTVVVGGDPAPEREVVAGLHRLQLEQPFLSSIRYAVDRAEISYWDEAETLDDAAAMAIRVWSEHRTSAGLPPWRVVGLEVLDRDTRRMRSDRGMGPSPLMSGEVRPL